MCPRKPSPECHPERRNFVTCCKMTESKFCGAECPQADKKRSKTASAIRARSGICDGSSQRLLSLGYIFAAGSRGRLSLQDVVCAGRHVRNRSQIPSSSNRFAIILVGFGSARGKHAAPFPKLRLRHFAACCEIPPLRMTHGVQVVCFYLATTLEKDFA